MIYESIFVHFNKRRKKCQKNTCKGITMQVCTIVKKKKRFFRFTKASNKCIVPSRSLLVLSFADIIRCFVDLSLVWHAPTG